ncbi:hypothetical protein [Nocardia abscessus]|nr:hypothetical protein [Nocardia abscessus]MCC3332373.1 hypothetical protein [Nocardia abscessus]
MTEPGNQNAPELGDQTDTSHPDDLDLETRVTPENQDVNEDAGAVEPPD